MKASTAAEITGFAALVVAAFLVATVAGFIVLGLSLLLIGYATEDQAAALTVSRMLAPGRARAARRRQKRSNRRRVRRNNGEGREPHRWGRQPAEIVLHVKTD